MTNCPPVPTEETTSFFGASRSCWLLFSHLTSPHPFGKLWLNRESRLGSQFQHKVSRWRPSCPRPLVAVAQRPLEFWHIEMKLSRVNNKNYRRIIIMGFISIQVATLPPNNYSSFLDEDGCAVSSFMYEAHSHRRIARGFIPGPETAQDVSTPRPGPPPPPVSRRG